MGAVQIKGQQLSKNECNNFHTAFISNIWRYRKICGIAKNWHRTVKIGAIKRRLYSIVGCCRLIMMMTIYFGDPG